MSDQPDPILKRLAEKFKGTPKWSEDFPVDLPKDTEISRRDFVRFLCLVSLGLFTGTFGVIWRGLTKRAAEENAPAPKPFRIAGLEDVGVGDSYVFQIPGSKEAAILVRLAKDRYVAYSQKCTHLQCPVLWKKGENKLLCPCHHGAFDVESGKVLFGPPERPLPVAKLETRPDGIYFLGMEA